jgi:hypothetical protein
VWKLYLDMVNEEFYLPGCNTVESIESQLKSQRNMSPLLATCFTLVSCLAYSLALKMGATHSSETPADFQQTTQCYIPEDSTAVRM